MLSRSIRVVSLGLIVAMLLSIMPVAAVMAGTSAPEPVDARISGVVTRASRAERRDAVLSALDELSDDDRAIIVLRGIEQADLKDAAAQLGITTNAASVRYHRALARLRERLPGSIFDDLRNE